MMVILKKGKISKNFCVIYFITSIIFLGACSSQKELVLEDFKEKIIAGMTENEVKKKVGEPEKIEKNSKEVIRKWHSDSNDLIDMWPESFYDKFFWGEKKEQYFFKKTDQTTGWIYFEYNYRDKSYKKLEDQIRTFRIYFVDDEVVWMSFP